MFHPAFSLPLLAISAQLGSAAFVDYTLNIVNTQVAPDGFSRKASLVNGKFPGTVLFANKGDVLRNTVVNQLTDPTMRRSTTIHWHGLYQRTTAYEDGPAFVTQCPIAPGASYQYVIPLLDQAGTHWYHSHLGSQYVDGVRSAIVIYDPNDPHKALYDVDDESTVIQLSDWYHKPAPILAEDYFDSGKEPVPDTGLINGRGRYKGGPAAPWSVINVQKGKRYRFRVLNNSALGYFKFEIDGHLLKIIEADGLPHQPVVVKSVEIHPGERYSIVVEANQTVGNYWIRAPITARRSSNTLDPELVKAVLRYEGAPASDPTTSRTSGTTLDIASLKPVENPGAPGGSGKADVVIDLKYGGVSGGKTGWQVNDSQYKPPTLPTLLKILSNNATTNKDFAKSENTIVLPFNKVVELQIHGSSNGFFHPWHLHGHSFDIIQNGGAANYINPPRKDVIPVGGGTAIIRFKTSNPGPWFLHCHVDWHLEVSRLSLPKRPTNNEQAPKPSNRRQAGKNYAQHTKLSHPTNNKAGPASFCLFSTLDMSKNGNGDKPRVPFAIHIIAGGTAGMAEALCCQPLDTIKVRMQLSRSGRVPGTKPRGFIATGMSIARRETPLALYKGLGAVLSGIVPKMAIRFASFETYKSALADNTTGKTSTGMVFLAGLGAGVTEAVAVVTPMEVVKIRLQAQQHSLADPLEVPRYRNAAHAAYTIVREEGFGTLYRGVSLTALRQATNQGANFTAYQELKKAAHKFQPDLVDLPSWQHMAIGLISGAMGPFSNAPIDTIKTRLQKSPSQPGQSALSRITAIAGDMWKQEGVRSFYKGITPRVLRVAPGQAIVFAVYERVRKLIESVRETNLTDTYSE